MHRFVVLAAAIALAAPLSAAPLSAALAQPAQKTATRTAAVAPAPAWRVDPAASRVSVGESTSGYGFNFDRWSADLRFDPANLAGSSAVVTIEMGSARTGDATNDATLRDSWMNARQHPQAVFRTTSFRALGANRYEAPGTLSLRGRTFPVTLTFTATITGNQAAVAGETQLDRAAMGFNVDPRFEWVSRLVNVKVNLRAVRAG